MRHFTISRYALLVFPLLLLLSIFFIARSALVGQEYMTDALILDLIVTFPILYFLVIRRIESIPNYTAISVLVISLLTASYIVPTASDSIFPSIKGVLIPIIEIGIFTVVFLKARAIWGSYRLRPKSDQIDFFDIVNEACTEVLPGRIASLMATEIAVIYYLFARRSTVANDKHYFSHHRKNQIGTTLYCLLGLASIEVMVTHLVLSPSYPTLALVLGLIGIYSFLQIIALIRSLERRRSYLDVENKTLILKYGFFAQTKINLDNILRVEESSKSLPEDSDVVAFSPFMMVDSHNLIIRLREEHNLETLYGFNKPFRSLALNVDQKEAFIELIVREIID